VASGKEASAILPKSRLVYIAFSFQLSAVSSQLSALSFQLSALT